MGKSQLASTVLSRCREPAPLGWEAWFHPKGTLGLVTSRKASTTRRVQDWVGFRRPLLGYGQ